MKTKIITFISSFMLSLLCCLSLPAQAENPTKTHSPPKINLNQADAQTLSKVMKGVGKKRAEAIIAYREAHHGFKSIDELAKVKSLGASYLKKNRQQLESLFFLEKKST